MTTTTEKEAAVIAARRMATEFANHGGMPLYAVACAHVRAALVGGWVLMFEAQDGRTYGVATAHALAEVLDAAARTMDVVLERREVSVARSGKDGFSA